MLGRRGQEQGVGEPSSRLNDFSTRTWALPIMSTTLLSLFATLGALPSKSVHDRAFLVDRVNKG